MSFGNFFHDVGRRELLGSLIKSGFNRSKGAIASGSRKSSELRLIDLNLFLRFICHVDLYLAADSKRRDADRKLDRIDFGIVRKLLRIMKCTGETIEGEFRLQRDKL